MLRHDALLFERGLTRSEVERVEDRFGFDFPEGPMQEVLQEIESEAITFVVEKEEEAFAFWPVELFGTRPDRLDEAVEVARAHLMAAPKLVPFRWQVYVPSQPHEAGNPLLDFRDNEFGYFGHDLPGYLASVELGPPEPEWARDQQKDPRSIPFWGWWLSRDDYVWYPS